MNVRYPRSLLNCVYREETTDFMDTEKRGSLLYKKEDIRNMQEQAQELPIIQGYPPKASIVT